VWVEDGVTLGFAAGDPGDGQIWASFVCPTTRARGSVEPFISQMVGSSPGKTAKGEVVFQKRLVALQIEIMQTRPEDAVEIADLHLAGAARWEALPAPTAH